ncbi:MAG: signal recognition particle protein [Desulfovibrionaceae bacterium]|nr:signal recognition particle protein [Desulfovibrionaceae bacterium]
MFDSLSDRLCGVFRSLTGQKKLTEDNIQSGLREVRLALLEADVNFNVVKKFVESVREKCVGEKLVKGVNPGQQVVKFVYDELVQILGGETSQLNLEGSKPASIMLVGLQGSGKTTSAGKLANLLRKQKMRPYLVPLDVYRPAAIDQLVALSKQLNVPCFPSTTDMTPREIALQAREKALEADATVMLLDTAGRLHVDEPLMNELSELKEILHPQEILFVADAMTGQDAVNVAQAFHDKIQITGVVLTKMDGDARGGAALSIKSVLGASVKFVGVGEKLSEMEVFHPDRIASRILGMGDVLTLVERAQEEMSLEEAAALTQKMKKAKFDFEDFRNQLRQFKKLGSFETILKFIPGLSAIKEKMAQAKDLVPDKELGKIEAIINSMTVAERHNPDLLDKSRCERIAKGSGHTVKEVDQLIANFKTMRKFISGALSGKKMPGMPKQLRNMAQGLNNIPGMAGSPELEALGQAGLPAFGSSDSPRQNASRSEARKKKRKEKRKHGKK